MRDISVQIRVQNDKNTFQRQPAANINSNTNSNVLTRKVCYISILISNINNGYVISDVDQRWM